VFSRGWRRQRGWSVGQWRSGRTVILGCLCILAACQRLSDRDWQGRYEEARRKLWYGYFADALQEADDNYRASAGKLPTWAWRFQTLKAQALLFQGKPSEALALLQPTVASGLPPDVGARKRIAQADALCRLGRNQEAEPILAEGDGLVSNDRRMQAEAALVRGRCASNREAAKGYFLLASTLAHGSDEFIEATGILNVGFALLQDKHYDEAIDKFLEGLSVTVSPLLQDRMLGNLGFAYSQQGDWKRAISFSERAEKMAEEIKNSEAREKWLIDLGKGHQALYELPAAESSYLQALSIAQTRGDQTGAAACFNNLTRLALTRQDVNQAQEYLKKGEALRVNEEELHFALDAAKVAAARRQWKEAERLLEVLIPKAKTDALVQALAQLDLGKVYWQENELARADRMFRDGIATAEAMLSHKNRPEDRLAFLDQGRFYDPYISFLATQHRKAEALQIAERGRAEALPEASKAQGTSMPVPKAQAILKRQGQVLLTYWVTDEETYLWVITPARFELFKLPDHRALHLQIESYNRELQRNPEVAASPAAQKLFETVIQPAESMIPSGSHVIIVPSKVLSWVSFEALVVPGQNPHYWIDDVDVQVTSSMARIARASSSPAAKKNEKELLIIGDPVQASKEFPALGHARDEMQRIAAHFPADRQADISGKKATPQAYLAAGPGAYRLIHLDTHGTASDLSPLDSAIILSPDADNTYKLYAREIRNIPLHADLVTISACYGAGTRWYNNEGVVGLGWAFLHAGARQVIAALWEVDDASTPQLMDDFYGELTQGKSAAEALRDAKLKMLHSASFYRHPYYWASLQLYAGS
jgi:CHAT domain-containing protein